MNEGQQLWGGRKERVPGKDAENASFLSVMMYFLN